MTADEATRIEAAIDATLAAGRCDDAAALAARYREGAQSEPPGLPPARSLRFRSAYSSGQVALAAGRLTEARAFLVPLVPRLTAPAPAACRLRLLAAEACARLGAHDEAAEYLRQAGSPTEAPLLLRAVRVRLILGESPALIAELSRCYALLKDKGDATNAALLAEEEGLAWHREGDLDRAEACWRRALDDARGALRASVLGRLGWLWHLRGRLQDALDAYDAASQPGAPQVAVQVRLRRLMILPELGRHSEAREDLARLRLETPPEQMPEELRSLYDAVVALLEGGSAQGDEAAAFAALRGGDRPLARAAYERAAAREPSPPRAARLWWACAALALQDGDPAAAAHLDRLDATNADSPEVRWRAAQLRGRLAAAAGDESAARGHFERAAALVEAQANRLRQPLYRGSYRQLGSTVLAQLLDAAARRGDVASVFRYQELQRGRLLLELWLASDRKPLGDDPELKRLDEEIRTHDDPDRRAALGVQRDRLLERWLADQGRSADARLPALPSLERLCRALRPGVAFVAPSLTEQDVCLVVARRDGACLVRAPGAERVGAQIDAWRRAVRAAIVELEATRQLPPSAPLDDALHALGTGPLGAALRQALRPGERLTWAPDGPLHGVPVHALRDGTGWLIERHDVVHTFSGASLTHQAQTRPRRRWFAPDVVVSEVAEELRYTAAEAERVAAALRRPRVMNGAAATLASLLPLLRRARVMHFACHADFRPERPLSACIQLPSGETLDALAWLGGAAEGLPLVTLSACRSSEVAPLAGDEVFGLAVAVLSGGVRAVVAGAWPVPDAAQTVDLMSDIYRRRLTDDLAAALAGAQRASLARRGSTPLVWAAFGLFGDPQALPAAGWLTRWWHRRQQRRHAGRFAALG